MNAAAEIGVIGGSGLYALLDDAEEFNVLRLAREAIVGSPRYFFSFGWHSGDRTSGRRSGRLCLSKTRNACGRIRGNGRQQSWSGAPWNRGRQAVRRSVRFTRRRHHRACARSASPDRKEVAPESKSHPYSSPNVPLLSCSRIQKGHARGSDDRPTSTFVHYLAQAIGPRIRA